MSFSAFQLDELTKPLDANRVKHRKQGGKQLSYLEGYDVIDKANEIFGHHAWSMKLLDMVYRRERDMGWYEATVEVTVIDDDGLLIVRQDVGDCDVAAPRDQGIDGAQSHAYSTARKGAATDALKRCLRTFGPQFGNALYDKDDPSNVQVDTPPQDNGRAPAPRRPEATPPPLTDENAQSCPGCGSLMTLRSGTTKDGRPYTAWFCTAKCGQKPIWLNDKQSGASVPTRVPAAREPF